MAQLSPTKIIHAKGVGSPRTKPQSLVVALHTVGTKIYMKGVFQIKVTFPFVGFTGGSEKNVEQKNTFNHAHDREIKPAKNNDDLFFAQRISSPVHSRPDNKYLFSGLHRLRHTIYHELLKEFPFITKLPNPKQPVKHNTVHHIITKGSPVVAKPRRLAPNRLKIAKTGFQNMMHLGHLRPSKSNYTSPLHMVPKKGTLDLRPVGDYIEL
ncbi:transposon Ty3-I Gag-Pol polyprotein [Trichonephila clavipes]|nr:transposon Ty3-I Gag-Pol polyprotein [Trichonephila clavipes]